jgi:hypothetical protein
MTTLSIQPPYPIITGADGQPLEDGYVWIGTANLNPITNPIAVYWDAALTQPAGQPVRTRGGYPVNAGTPARLYVGSDYSVLVQNKNGSTVYSSLNDNAFFASGGSGASNATGNGVQTIFPVSSIPRAVYINGVYQNQNTYTVAGGNVTFTQAPPVTSTIEFLI